MVEACALISRSIGLVLTLAAAAGWMSQGTVAFSPILIASCYVAIGIMASANVFTVLALRRPKARRYEFFAAAQVALDTLLTVGMVVFFAIYGQRTTWPLLAVPIVVAALRLRLKGALAVWAVTSGSFVAVTMYMGDRAVRPEDLPFAVGIHLLVALVTGTQASAFHRQLATLQQARTELQHRASHDALTGLPNRARLDEFYRGLGDEAVVLLLLDLDGFKPVNDVHGHSVGDEVLRVVSRRLSDVLRPQDLAGRLGGDEFLVLLPTADAGTAETVTQRIRQAIEVPIMIGGRVVQVGTSIGSAMRPAGGPGDLEALTVAADALMYADKGRRKRTPSAA
jgi:diguanylate cyclase (GGDEF)-like protein